MMKQRQCGCDCRDDDMVFPNPNQPNGLCCPTCDPTERPCCYVARFGCSIPEDPDALIEWPTANLTPPRSSHHAESKDGDVYLRVICATGDGCEYVSVFIAPNSGCSRSGYTDHYTNQDTYDTAIVWMGEAGCTWPERALICVDYSTDETDPDYTGQNIHLYWKLDLAQDPITLTHLRADIEYAIPADEWVCNGQNTMVMTVVDEVRKDGGYIQLPSKVCVAALPEENHDHCDDELPCDYASETDRCACCDDCCPKQSSYEVRCGAETATVSGTSTTSDVAGVNSPAGRSYMLTGDVTFGGTTYSLKFVTYCDGTDWLLDIYCDDVLDQTGLVVDFTCCPLTGNVEFDLSCLVCEPPPDCDGVPMATTLTADDFLGNTPTLTWNGTQYEGSAATFANCSPATLEYTTCGDPDAWALYVNGNQIDCKFMTGNCDPYNWETVVVSPCGGVVHFAVTD